ncbi:MAG TPA: hypothetical protein VGG28_15165, partial [Kofleriaceae bacterium]
MMVLVVLAGCASNEVSEGTATSELESSVEMTQHEWDVVRTLSPLPDLPVDTTNRYADSRAAARLGQKLFFEPRLSGPIQTGTPAEGQLGAIGEK